jgi:hypothetical protein
LYGAACMMLVMKMRTQELFKMSTAVAWLCIIQWRSSNRLTVYCFFIWQLWLVMVSYG